MRKTTSVLAQILAEKLQKTKKKTWTAREKEEVFNARFPKLPEHSDLYNLQKQLENIKTKTEIPKERSLERRCRVCGSFLRAVDKRFCWYCKTPIQR